MNYQETSRQLLEHLGGRENIEGASHCTTRLRLIVKDQHRINEEKIGILPGVKGTFMNDGQFQVLLGAGAVNKVYHAFMKE